MRSFLRSLALSSFLFAGVAAGCAPAHTGPAPADRSTVTSEDLRDSNQPIEMVLQKKVPGLVVRRTDDGGVALQIRGSSSYLGDDTPPLYVLDGMPFEPGPGGALTGINPHDIDTIKVLKSAEAGLYGIQGAHGVIVITTKKAGKKTP